MNPLKILSLGLAALPVSEALAQAEHPNILLIMTDQQSFNTIGAHSDLYAESYSETPNIDRLVRNGVSFTQTYCANPVSVPSRFSLFTGVYGGQYAVRENRTALADEEQVRAMLAENAMGNVFARGGYDTYYGGKVHLPFAGTKGGNKFAAPEGYGFETYYTRDEREILSREAARLIDQKGQELERGRMKRPFLMVASFLNPHDICLEGASALSNHLKDEESTDPRTRQKVECIRRIRELAAGMDSLDFYMNHAPQLPFNYDLTSGFPDFRRSPAHDFPDYYWRKYRWIYSELVRLVDAHIGEVLDALDRNPKLKENTVVIFTSDHGEMQGAHRRMQKNIPYEECQRVPFIFCGKGIPRGERDHSLVCNGVDLLPTMCALAGIEAPRTDGCSLEGHLLRGDRNPLREALYTEGDEFLSVISGDYKYTLFDGRNQGAELLVDLKDDSGEMINIIDRHQSLARKLKACLPLEKLKVYRGHKGGVPASRPQK